MTVCSVGFSALPFCAGVGAAKHAAPLNAPHPAAWSSAGMHQLRGWGMALPGISAFLRRRSAQGLGAAKRGELHRTRCIRPCGRARRHTNFAVGRRRCGSRMLPSCGATIHAGSAGRLRRAAGLLRRNMILLRDLGGAIRRNARRLLHRLGIASADGRALRSCRTGRWRILRAARLLRPRTGSCAVSRISAEQETSPNGKLAVFLPYRLVQMLAAHRYAAQTGFLPYRIAER